MASNTINFKGTFDASEILKALQQIRQQMKQAGASSSLFDGIDKDMEKAQTLIASLTAQLQKGFKNPKEVQSFAKEFDKLDTCLVKIQNGFKEINTTANFNTKTGEINKLTQKLEEATAKQKSYAEAARKAVDSQLDDLNLKEKDIKAIKKEIASQEELERVLKQVGQAREKAAQKTIGDKYQGSATAQTAAKDLTQSALGSTTVGWTDNQGRTTEQTKEIYGKAYLKVLDETLKKGQNAAQAYGAFRKELEKYDIVLEDVDESQKAFNADLQRINQIVYDEASPQVKGAITKARNAQNGLGSTDANGDFQLNQTGLGLINNADVQNHIRNEQLISQATRERQIKQQQGEREAEDAVRRHDQALEEETQHEKQLSTSVNQATQELYEQSSAAQQVDNTFENMKNTVKMILSITSAWQALKNVIRQTFEDVKNLDKAFGSIAMVTNKTVGELWASYGQYAEMANKLGQSTADAIKASALFYQQGLDTAEALSLTEDTMKLATLSGQGFEQATQQMTAALRGFHMEMEEGSHITDVYSELAAHAAADVHGIAYAMSKTASIANNAGMSFENTSAFLTQMIETTQEAPENIGTAMKTIIARFTELKENVAGTADSEFDDLDYNKVDKALKTVGVSLKDASGQFRNLDDVFLELSSKWNTLDRNSQRYIATIAAGSRQQSRFIAMMENYERTMELVETAQDSAGRSEEQFAKYQDTVEYKLNQLKNSWEQLRVSFLDSDLFKGAIDQINGVVIALQKIDFKKLLVLSPIIISLAKNFVMTFINTAQGMTKQYQQLGTIIGQSIRDKINEVISNSPLPIQTEIRNIGGEIDLRSAQLQGFKDVSEEATALSKMFGLTGQEMFNLSEDSEEYKQILEAMGGDSDYLQEELFKLALAEENSGTSALEAGRRIEELNSEMEKSKQKAQMMSQGVQMIAQTVAAGLTAWISTGDFEAGLDAILASTAAFGVQILMSLGTTFATAAIEAHAGGEAIGTALSEGLAATGPGLIIAAILGSLALLAGITKLAIKHYKETHKSINQQIQETEEKIKELQKQAAELKDQSSTQQEEVKNIKELQERYDELNNKQLKTVEEEEEFNELIQTIKDQFPEIVKSYDEQNNKLYIQNDLWDSILEKQKQAAIESKNAYLANQQLILNEEQNKIALEQQKQQQSSFSQILSGNNEVVVDNDFINKLIQAGFQDYSQQGAVIEFLKILGQNLDENKELTEEAIRNAIEGVYNQGYYIEGQNITIDGQDFQNSYFNEDEIEQIKQFFIEEKNIQNQILQDLTNQNNQIKEQRKLIYGQEIENNLGTGDAQSRFISNFIAGEEGQINLKVNQKTNEKFDGRSIDLADWNSVADVIGEEGKAGWQAIIDKGDSDYLDQLEDLYKTNLALQERVSLAEEYLDYMNKNGMSEDELQNFFNKINTDSQNELNLLLKNLDENNEYDKVKIDYITEAQRQNETLIQDLEGYFNLDTLSNMGSEQLQSLKNNIAEVGEKAGISQENLQNFTKKIELLSKTNKLGQDFINKVTFLQWSNLDETNFSETIKSWAEQIAEDTEIPFEKVHEQLLLIAEDAEKIGLADNLTRNEQEVEAFVASLNEVRENAMKQKDTFIKAITDQATLGRLSLDNMVSLQKSLTELGEDYHDYITISNGQAILDQEKLKTLYAEKVNYQKRELQLMLNKAELERRSLQLEYDQAEAIYAQCKNEVNLLKVQELSLKINMQDLAIEKLKTEIEFDIGDVALNDFNVDLTKSINSATKSIEDAAKKVADAEEKVTEATKKLNEALYGLEEHKNKLDFLYNYQTNLDRITKKANEAKEALEDLKGESATEQLDKYLSGVHSEAVTRKAENQVIQNSINNYQSVLDTKLAEKIAEINAANPSRNLSTNVSDYYTKVGDRLNVNFQALNAAQLPDDLSDYVEETIEQINKLSDEIEKNDEELKKREKEFLDMQKKARQDYIKLEDQVISTLKEKYDEEIKATEDKYKAIEEADNEYLDALKEAIDKQRKLREQANQWDDLQTKEKKLALMQRDTSGANASEINSLQKEIENDREQLLDNAVDNILDSLKEMYDLQKETRDAELEYQKAVLDNAVLVQEANAIIDSWNSADDAVAWFYENTKDLSEMSVAKLEEETEQWRELYDTKTTYMATSQADFESALSTTAEEIQSIVDATSETLTTEADRSLTEITNKVTEAIKSAEKTLEDAIKALEEAKQSYSDATGSATGSPGSTADGNQITNSRTSITYGDKAYEIDTGSKKYKLGLGESSAAASYKGDIALIQEGAHKGRYILGTSALYEMLTSGDSGQVDAVGKILLGNQGDKTYSKEEIEKLYPVLKGQRQRMNAYASGGLVNYTGPAWVDGTPSKPEAFLSPEDTQRIGAAAQLLSNLPILNSTSNANTTVTSNIGDTAIDIHINIENVSSDYDVDQMIERVKQDIVDVSNPIGSPIILRK